MVGRLLSERGAALVLALMATAMLVFVAIGLSLSSNLAATSVGNFEEALGLENACESAIQIAARELALVDIDDVLSGSVTSPLIDGPPGLRTIAANVTIDLPTMTNQLTCGSSAPCTAAQTQAITAERPWGVNNPQWRLFIHQPLAAPVLPRLAPSNYIVVWIADDAREDDGDSTRDGAGAMEEGRYIVRVRAEAFGSRGGRRAVEAELTRPCVDDPSGEICLPGSRVQSWRMVSSLVP